MAPPMLRVVKNAILNVMSERDEVLAVLRTVLPELRRGWPIRSLALFGSVARGEAAPTSDLDILVEFEAPIGLSDILAACQSIIGFAQGMTLDGYLADEKTRYAVMRGYEIMGEAVRHVPDAIKLANPDIPWATMAAVRNRIVHAYFGIDDSILFLMVEKELKALLPRLEDWARTSRVG